MQHVVGKHTPIIRSLCKMSISIYVGTDIKPIHTHAHTYEPAKFFIENKGKNIYFFLTRRPSHERAYIAVIASLSLMYNESIVYEYVYNALSIIYIYIYRRINEIFYCTFSVATIL